MKRETVIRSPYNAVVSAILLRFVLIAVDSQAKLKPFLDELPSVGSWDSIAEERFLHSVAKSHQDSLLVLLPEIIDDIRFRGCINVCADIISAVALYNLGGALHGLQLATAYLFNPFTILACICGWTSSLFTMSALVFITLSSHNRPLLAALVLCCPIAVKGMHLLDSLVFVCIGVVVVVSRQKMQFLLTCVSGLAAGCAVLGYWTRISVFSEFSTIPDIGLQWYLSAEAFPKFRRLFKFAFDALPPALAAAIAIEGCQSKPWTAVCSMLTIRNLLCCQPKFVDTVLCMAMLPLAVRELMASTEDTDTLEKRKRSGAWLFIGFCMVLLLCASSYKAWLVMGIANVNYFYGMTLLWAAWQVAFALFLLQP